MKEATKDVFYASLALVEALFSLGMIVLMVISLAKGNFVHGTFYLLAAFVLQQWAEHLLKKAEK